MATPLWSRIVFKAYGCHYRPPSSPLHHHQSVAHQLPQLPAQTNFPYGNFSRQRSQKREPNTDHQKQDQEPGKKAFTLRLNAFTSGRYQNQYGHVLYHCRIHTLSTIIIVGGKAWSPARPRLHCSTASTCHSRMSHCPPPRRPAAPPP